MKKFISLILASAVLASFTVSPISAQEIYSDYIAEDKAGNIIPDASLGGGSTYLSARNNGAIDAYDYYTTDQGNGGSAVRWAYSGTSPLTLAWGYRNYFDGIEINSQAGYVGFSPKGGTTYVFSANVKNASTNGVKPYIGVSMVDGDFIKYTLDTYGSTGMQIDSGWQTISGMIETPSVWKTSSYSNAIYFGFPAGTLPGAAFWLDVSEKNSVYFGEEYAYDIINELTSSSEIDAGDTVTAKAFIINQIEKTGNIPQDIDWFIVNEQRDTIIEEGFEITKNGNEVSVTAQEGVTGGTYILIAQSESESKLLKGVEFSVKVNTPTPDPDPDPDPDPNPDPDPDIDPEQGEIVKNQNLIPDVTSGGGDVYLGARNDSNIGNSDFWSPGITGYCFKYTYSGKGDYVLSNAWRGFGGFELNSQGGKFGFVPKKGKTYVISAMLKNASSNGVIPYFGVAVNGTYSPSNIIYTNEYGKTGMAVCDEWTEFKATVTYPDNYADESGYGNVIMCGFPNGTKEGSAIWIDISNKDSFYFAEEQAYDLSFETEKAEHIYVDTVLNYDGAVLNQIGIKGGLNQELIFNIFDENGNDASDKINIDTVNKIMTVTKDALPEKYTIKITSKNYKGLEKNVEILVEVSQEVINAIVNALNEGTAEDISKDIDKYISILNLKDDCIINADKEELAKLIHENAEDVAFTVENTEDILKRLSVIAMYNKNADSLYDNEGNFTYSDILGIGTESGYSCDKNGTTFSQIFSEKLTETGKISLQKSLLGNNFNSEKEFYDAFYLNTILFAIECPISSGNSYVENILTEKNADAAGLNIKNYLSLTNKASANKTLARNAYTKETLEKTIFGLTEQTNTSSGTSSSGTGSSNGSGSKKNNAAPVIPSVITSGADVSLPQSTEKYDMFSDVLPTHWAYDEIYHLKKLGIISGIDGEHFSPDNNVTREQFVKMFIDAFNYKKVSGNLNFSDIKDGAWYNIYLSTAVENGIINGMSENEFGVGLPISRQDICVILMRAMKGEAEADGYDKFTDFDDISDYAKDAVIYLSNYGVINGFEDGTFLPKNNCTRAQAAKIICTLINLGGISK